MSFNKRHITELLTEGQYATVAVYFNTEASKEQEPAWSPEQTRRQIAVKQWGAKQDSVKNLLSAPQFPFIDAALPADVYVYKCSLAMAQQMKTGDRVVVPPTGRNPSMRVATVWQVHATPQIDFSANFDYKWIVQVLDTAEYDEHMDREMRFKAMLLEVEKVKEREAIRASVLGNVDPGSEAYRVFEQALRLMNVPAPVVATEQTVQVNQAPEPAPAAAPAPAFSAPTFSFAPPPKV